MITNLPLKLNRFIYVYITFKTIGTIWSGFNFSFGIGEVKYNGKTLLTVKVFYEFTVYVSGVIIT